VRGRLHASLIISTIDRMYTEMTDPYCIDDDDAARMLAAAPWRRFVVIGDSLSAGTGDPSRGYRPAGWSDRVAEILRRVDPSTTYVNTAVVGATTKQILADQAPRIAALQPDLIHLPSGPNDLIAREPDFTEIAGDLSRLWALAADTGAQITAFTLGRAFVVPHFPDWTDRVRRVNAITRRLAADHDAVLVDMWAHPVNDRPELLSADRIHFSSSGQAVMAAEIVVGLAAKLATAPEVSA
jgi:lysophospholipase L1-like esterase